MFTTIYGHDQATSYLQGLVESGDLPSAMLFHGERGVGKRATAVALAKMLNCREDQTTECTCKSCRKIEGDTHLDVLTYQPDGKTFKIDQVRALIEESNRRRMEGDWRVFILEDADCLNSKAADALLKTLEDGRPNALFILLSESKRAIVPTLVSRTLDFYFGALTEEDVKRTLLSMKFADNRRLESSVRLSGGSVERALYFLTGNGFEVRDDALSFLSEYPNIQDFKVISKINGLEDEALHEFVQMVYDLLSDLCLMARDQGAFIRNSDIEEHLEHVARRFGPRSFNAFSKVRALLQRKDRPVAYDHHVKSTMLDLKDEIRQ
jgi:DNA polymerase-3 subunit delta'